jgi:molybdenum cofactor cytidylyltransferase
VGISAILLAAGAGNRFGGRKLLQPLADGTPIGVSALRNLRKAIDRVVVVVRDGDEELAARFAQENATVVTCKLAVDGMGHSLAAGVQAESDADGWLVALGDMPHVRADTIRAVAEKLATAAGIVVPTYRGERGHPVAFGSRFKEELLSLSGDTGARVLLKLHADQVVRLDVDDPCVLQDIDTPSDLARLR